MEKLKCTECGQVFDKNLSACPNCGCPAEEASIYTEKTTSFIDESEGVWASIKRWWSPGNVYLTQNRTPIVDKTVKVDDDSDIIFEHIKSLFYICLCIAIKFVITGTLCLIPLFMINQWVVIGLVKSRSLVLITAWTFFAWTVVVFIFFVIFFSIFKSYWKHIFFRIKEIHIRYWRSMYRAVKDIQ